MTSIQNLETLLPELLKNLGNVKFSWNANTFLFTLAAYVFMALGLYTIARKRNLKSPWLAWIPVADLWLLGCISDQYHYVTKGREFRRRNRLLGLCIARLILSWITVIMAVACAIGLAGAFLSGNPAALGAGVILLVVMAVLCLLLFVAFLVVSVILLIQRCYALYDLFCSCEIQNKTLYSVLSILGTCLGIHLFPAVCVFICREKEEGMPPRIVDVE